MTAISLIMLGLLACAVMGIAVFIRMGLSGTHLRRARTVRRRTPGEPVDHGSYRHGGGGWFVD